MGREVRRMRTSINKSVAAVIAILVAMFGISLPAMCAEQPKWSISGDSLFKVYWQTTLRVANETNLVAGGGLGPLYLEGRVRLTGSTWGIPDDAIVVGPWGERLDKWTVSARAGSLSLQLGDTTVPVLSGLYLAGRSLYGGVATWGGRLGASTGTATGFYGVNTVSSGRSISSHKLAGGAAELSLSRNLGLVVQGMRATKDQFGLDMGGARAWIRMGTASLNAEVVASRSGSSDDLGWVALAGAQTQLFGGMLSVSGQYTAADFASLNSAAAGKAGGAVSQDSARDSASEIMSIAARARRRSGEPDALSNRRLCASRSMKFSSEMLRVSNEMMCCMGLSSYRRGPRKSRPCCARHGRRRDATHP